MIEIELIQIQNYMVNFWVHAMQKYGINRDCFYIENPYANIYRGYTRKE